MNVFPLLAIHLTISRSGIPRRQSFIVTSTFDILSQYYKYTRFRVKCVPFIKQSTNFFTVGCFPEDTCFDIFLPVGFSKNNETEKKYTLLSLIYAFLGHHSQRKGAWNLGSWLLFRLHADGNGTYSIGLGRGQQWLPLSLMIASSVSAPKQNINICILQKNRQFSVKTFHFKDLIPQNTPSLICMFEM